MKALAIVNINSNKKSNTKLPPMDDSFKIKAKKKKCFCLFQINFN